MKNNYTKILVGLIALCCGLNSFATTRTVNNSSSIPGSPGQYTSIGSAISASSAGDTILVTGTISGYAENLNITKQLTIIGAGYAPQYQQATILNGYVQFSSGANGSAIMGFQMCWVYFTSPMRNILVYRNYIYGYTSACGIGYGPYGVMMTSDQCSYITFAENVINYAFNLNGYEHDTGLVIVNNIFPQTGNGIYGGSTNIITPEMLIDHNLFMAGSYSTPSTTSYSYALQIANAIVSNNIFYGVVPIDTNNSSAYTSNTFYNNLTYASTTIKSLPWGGNDGSGNINNANPEFTSSNLFPDASFPYIDFKNTNLRPMVGSPVINTALDLTNIGPTGGPYPIYNSTVPWLTGEPPLPEVESAIFTGGTAVPPGTPLNLQVKAKKIN